MKLTGWSYLVVTHDPQDAAIKRAAALAAKQDPPRVYLGTDGCQFATEAEMLSEVGATSWELLFIRDEGRVLKYYFRRSRS